MTDKTQLLPVTPELLPCPFCGGEPVYFRAERGKQVTFRAYCRSCCARAEDRQTADEAIAAWNTRSTVAEEGLREALAEAYRKGASDVHAYWLDNPGEAPRGDPEFGEAASDYATAALDIFDSSAVAALRGGERHG